MSYEVKNPGFQTMTITLFESDLKTNTPKLSVIVTYCTINHVQTQLQALILKL